MSENSSPTHIGTKEREHISDYIFPPNPMIPEKLYFCENDGYTSLVPNKIFQPDTYLKDIAVMLTEAEWKVAHTLYGKGTLSGELDIYNFEELEYHDMYSDVYEDVVDEVDVVAENEPEEANHRSDDDNEN